MTFFNRPLPSITLAIPVLLGVTVFFLFTGGKILNPTYINWLLAGDPAQHWLGWEFFRTTPFDQWPIGANTDFGMERGSSIVFTDSIPIMAIIFKMFNSWLPEHFQYTGIWILLCFVLQGVFSWKLLSNFTESVLLKTIGCLFFLIAPSALWRSHAHFALSAHWMILCGFNLYFSKTFLRSKWLLLIVIAVLVHAYLLAMLLSIAIMDLLQRILLKQASLIKAAFYVTCCLLITFLVMWAAGYFMVGGGVTNEGFGFYRLNMLSVVDSDYLWSKLLPDIETSKGDYEGFNFLGTGMLGLFVVAFVTLVKQGSVRLQYTTVLPLLLLAVSLFIYALSNHVAAGMTEVLSYPLPLQITPLTDTFRASGRFFWPVYYLIYLTIFYLIFTRINNRLAVLICTTMLAIQLVDSSRARVFFSNKFSLTPEWSSPMISPLWAELSTRYKNIILVVPSSSPEDSIALPEFAATHQMSTNAGYFARTNPKVEQHTIDNLTSTVEKSSYTPDSLYVFENDALWDKASSSNIPGAVVGVLDGLRIVAPGLSNCTTCDMRDLESVSDSRRPPFTSSVLSFQTGGNATEYLSSGWSLPEPRGTWSEQNVATLKIPLSSIPDRRLVLDINANAFLAEHHPVQDVEVYINGVFIKNLRYILSSPGGVRSVDLPRSLNLAASENIEITFIFKNSIMPSELGLFNDNRHLGFNISYLELRSASN